MKLKINQMWKIYCGWDFCSTSIPSLNSLISLIIADQVDLRCTRFGIVMIEFTLENKEEESVEGIYSQIGGIYSNFFLVDKGDLFEVFFNSTFFPIRELFM